MYLLPECSEVIFSGLLSSEILVVIISSIQRMEFHTVAKVLETGFGAFSLFVPHYLMRLRKVSSLLMNQNCLYTLHYRSA